MFVLTYKLSLPCSRLGQGLVEITILLADLMQLAAAEVFVGTFSSNIGRLVAVMREADGKPRGAAMSVDTPDWHPGRRRALNT